MRRLVTTLCFAAVALALVVGSAMATTPLRSPQVVFDSGPLQGYLTSLGETVNVTADQADVQVWGVGVTGNTDFTLMLKNGVQDEIGVYNSSDPVPNQFMVFPQGATTGWYAQVHFGLNSLSVTLFDGLTPTPQGTTTYSGVDKNSFGFYVKSVNGTFYSQDGRNGRPMVLTFASTGGTNDWAVCFEDAPYPLVNPSGPASTFDSAIVYIQSVKPTPVNATTWGKLKSLYR